MNLSLRTAFSTRARSNPLPNIFRKIEQPDIYSDETVFDSISVRVQSPSSKGRSGKKGGENKVQIPGGPSVQLPGRSSTADNLFR